MTDKMPGTRAEAKAVGATHYFTGKPCKRGHIAKRLASTKGCVECQRAADIAWRAANPDKSRAVYATYRAKTQEKRAAYRAENRERISEYAAAWRTANRERCREYEAAWRAANPEKDMAKARNRRARKRNADGTCSADEAAAIRVVQRDRCAYCSVKLRGGGHLDHIVPLSKGGSNWPSNQQWLCGSCNLSKQAADPIDFARRKGFLI